MPYNSIINRTNAGPLIPEVVSNEVLQMITETSAVMGLARRLQNMSTAQTRMPVMSSLALGYFVNPSDTGLKHTTNVEWENKYISAEEVAVIVPIPQAVLDDAGYPIWDQVKPSIAEAFGLLIDQAVLYGTNIPASWTAAMGCAGLTAGSTHLHLAAYTDLYEAILGQTGAGAEGVFMEVEEDGYMVTGSIAHLSMRGLLRNCRDSDGNQIFGTSMQQPSAYVLDGSPIVFPLNGSVVAASSLLLSGQWDKLVYAMRQDMTFQVFTEGVVQDGAGTIVYNLMQQDMVALRATMRLGFALPKPITRIDTGAGFPFAYLIA